MTDADLQRVKDAVTRLSVLIDELKTAAELSSSHSVVSEAASLAGEIHQALTSTQTQFRIQGGPRTGNAPSQ